MKTWITLAVISFLQTTAFAQQRLAYIYGRDEYLREARKEYRVPVQLQGDSVLIVSSAILMNVAPDKYSITFGAAQVAATPSLAGKQINERIARFTKQLYKLGIAEPDIYIDFISQNKVYEFDLSGNKAVEKEAGFEIKKNITILFNREALAETMTEAAAAEQIFDVIKLDYLISDYTPFYKQLFAEAVQQIKDRKDMYVSATGMELLARSALNNDDLEIILPKTQYKKYTAYESGDVESDYRNLVKKELRKSSTAYYEGISQHGFDKIINNNKPGVFIQMALGVSFKYYLKPVK